MSGYFTQTRQLPNQSKRLDGTVRAKVTFNPSNPMNEIVLAARSYNQSTRSFRSGPGYGDDVITPGNIIRDNYARNVRPYDTGHEFSTRKGSARSSHSRWNVRYNDTMMYQGPLCFDTSPWTPNANRDWSFPQMDLTYGTKAINETYPTKSPASLTQFVAELVADLPQIPLKSMMKPRKGPFPTNVGNEYLNLVFGWQPTVNDVLKLCQAIVRTQDIIDQFVRDSGRAVRRKFDFTVKRSATGDFDPEFKTLLGFPNPGTSAADWFYPNAGYNGAYGQVNRTTEVTERYYFRGAFTYLLADSFSGNQLAAGAQAARKVLGLDGANLDTIYQLTRFSWLLDYFVNVGDIISNANAFSKDSLVLRYGYLMRETRIKDIYQHSGVEFRSGRTGPITFTESFIEKQRVRATPYGFGLNPNSFTESQWAILIALGLTNGNRALL